MQRTIVFISFLLLSVPLVFAQNPTAWSIDSEAKGKDLKSGQDIGIRLNAKIDAGWHLYALEQPEGGPIATTLRVTEGVPFEISGKIVSPKPIRKVDPLFTGLDGKPLETAYYTDAATFLIPLKATADTSASALTLDARFQLCNDTLCLPPKTVRVSFEGSELVSKAINTAPATSGTTPAANNAIGQQQLNRSEQSNDIWPFLWLAISLGALSLLTPCVFPMIPITVSYFSNHSGGSRTRSIKLAAIYSIGIIGTFTIVGMLLAIFVGAAGINLFAANPWINLLITAIFLFFAFNLFGAYEISIPSGLLTKLDRLTRSQEGEGGGIVGALLMGLTFTLTSLTCTSPFVGTILVSAAKGAWQMPLIGMVAFSTVFALPFFVLALAPQLVSQLPRAGGWMNSIKVAMGFLEVAAAMKFISNVDLVWKWGIFTRNVVLAIWIAIFVVLAFYLLGKFQLSHDSRPERLGAFRVISAVLSLAISFYLLTGLFGANLGELEAFLPPDLSGAASKFSRGVDDRSQWIKDDYAAALAKAKTENRNVFIDFTGYTCTNCRWMEANIFPKPAVEAELKKMVLVSLYTDGEGEIYERQQQMEQDMFGTVALPFYAIVDPQGKTIATFAGLTRNEGEFIDFLRKGEKN